MLSPLLPTSKPRASSCVTGPVLLLAVSVLVVLLFHSVSKSEIPVAQLKPKFVQNQEQVDQTFWDCVQSSGGVEAIYGKCYTKCCKNLDTCPETRKGGLLTDEPKLFFGKYVDEMESSKVKNYYDPKLWKEAFGDFNFRTSNTGNSKVKKVLSSNGKEHPKKWFIMGDASQTDNIYRISVRFDADIKENAIKQFIYDLVNNFMKKKKKDVQSLKFTLKDRADSLIMVTKPIPFAKKTDRDRLLENVCTFLSRRKTFLRNKGLPPMQLRICDGYAVIASYNGKVSYGTGLKDGLLDTVFAFDDEKVVLPGGFPKYTSKTKDEDKKGIINQRLEVFHKIWTDCCNMPTANSYGYTFPNTPNKYLGILQITKKRPEPTKINTFKNACWDVHAPSFPNCKPRASTPRRSRRKRKKLV